MAGMFLIVGLGNPGRRFAGSRHNMGFEVVDKIAKDNEIRIKESKFDAFAGEGFLGGAKLVLVKPTTYMNLSGEAVRDFVRYYKMQTEDFATQLIVVYDDIALPAGRIRVRYRGGAGGHNGMKSILYHLETEDFIRIRVGVGSRPDKMDLSSHVLGKATGDEADSLVGGILTAARAAEDVVRHGVDYAMNVYNPKPEAKAKKEPKKEPQIEEGDVVEE